MGKFRSRYYNSPFWKHENSMDVFFVIDKVRFDENGTHATIHINWMVQGTGMFWACTNTTRLNIRPDQYDKWKPYTPHGEIYHV